MSRFLSLVPAAMVATALSATALSATPAPAKTTSPPAAGPTKNPLALVARCLANSEAKGCDLTEGPLVIGASPDGKSLLHWDVKEVGGCGDEGFNSESKGLVVATVARGTLKRKTKHTFELPIEDDPKAKATRAKAWKAIAGIAKKGFVPLDDLITSTVDKQAGIQGHTPIANLGAELAGWQVAAVYAKGKYAVVLRRGKAKAHRLGKVKAPKMQQFGDEAGDDADPPKTRWIDAEFPSIEQVSLFKRGTKTLILVGLSGHDGSHCATGVVRYLTAALPAAAR